MDFDEVLDEFISHYYTMQESYRGAILVYYAIEDFIPWIWCSPLPNNEIIDFPHVSEFKIEEQNCRFELDQVFLSDMEFRNILNSIRTKSNEILIKGEKYSLPSDNPSALTSERQIGLGKESLTSRLLTISGAQQKYKKKSFQGLIINIFTRDYGQ